MTEVGGDEVALDEVALEEAPGAASEDVGEGGGWVGQLRDAQRRRTM